MSNKTVIALIVKLLSSTIATTTIRITLTLTLTTTININIKTPTTEFLHLH